MSISELLVIVIVIILVVKPEDIPIIFRKLQESLSYFTSFKKEIFSHFSQDLEVHNQEIEENIGELNFYLEKIISIEGNYEGKYTIKEVKDKYHKLVKKSLSDHS